MVHIDSRLYLQSFKWGKIFCNKPVTTISEYC
ncbi:MAG: hypothetical protein ACJAXV_001825, partial [Bacteroidia bacterium]